MLEEFLGKILKKNVNIIKYMRNEQTIGSVAEKIRIVDLLVPLKISNILEITLEEVEKYLN